jgi:dolichyl-phosphate-mannose--protein O-mannosyl transferase
MVRRDLLKYGVEVTGSKPEFIVHPPLGKWLIALGKKYLVIAVLAGVLQQLSLDH